VVTGQDIKNSDKKLVCQVDAQKRQVVIIKKKFKTIICFSDDGKVIVNNYKPTEIT